MLLLQEAALNAHTIANREGLAFARIAELEAGAAGAVGWFVASIMRFFDTEPMPAADTISKAQYRRYVAWMRVSR